MNEGVIVGGWGFVWAAYAVTAISLIAYTISLAIRSRSSISDSEGLDEQ